MEFQVTVGELRKRSLMIGVPMYSGMCTGSFTKSLMEFMFVAYKYGLDVKPYFIFNESLITRARNYIADEFMRSNYSRLLFIDSDIGFKPESIIHLLSLQSDESEYDVLCGIYPKKCLNSKTLVHTEDGKKTIAWVVNNEYNGKVLSVDNQGKFVWNKIISHSVEKNYGKKWLSLGIFDWNNENMKQPSSVILTDDHEVAYVNNPLDHDIKYTEARNMKGKWIVQTTQPDVNNVNRRSVRNALYNKDQFSVFVGTLIGDGHLSKDKGRFVVTHSNKQMKYNQYKADILGVKLHVREKNNIIDTTNAQTKYISSLYYKDGKKTIKNILPFIDEKALAFLYCDDGNRRYYPEALSRDASTMSWWYNEKSGENKRQADSPGSSWKRGRHSDTYKATSSIAMMSFSVEDVELFIEHIKEKFGIEGYIYLQKGNTERLPVVKFDPENTDKLHALIHPYIHESMEYKLNEQYRGLEKYEFSKEREVEFTCSEVKNVEEYHDKNNSKLYDIGVENNHNFVVNDGVVVHNCISWEKIKAAVDQGVADEDPTVLENYVGDFVFNPIASKSGTVNISLDQPVEVSESGTGFMMIRRSAFEKFKETYPDTSYKPDHVRSEHFDGSREINMFFQAAIDPESNRYLSEDYYFCKYLRKAGGKVWICPWIELSHTGTYVFSGSLQHLASIGQSATAGHNAPKNKRK